MQENKITKRIISIADSKGLSPEVLALRLASFLDKHDLNELLPKLNSILEETQKENDRIETIIIRSRYPLDREDISGIKKLISPKKEAPIKEIIDKSVIGGFIAEYNGTIYDGSLAKQVERLEKSLKEIKV